MRENWESLWRARYGANASPISESADATLQTILTHKSVRDFRPDPLPVGTLELLTAAAQSAATSSNLQTWSVIALRDAEHKAKAAMLSGNQEFIRQAPLFLVFCADLSRLDFVSAQAGTAGEGLDYLEMFLMASIDASLAAAKCGGCGGGAGVGNLLCRWRAQPSPRTGGTAASASPRYRAVRHGGRRLGRKFQSRSKAAFAAVGNSASGILRGRGARNANRTLRRDDARILRRAGNPRGRGLVNGFIKTGWRQRNR